MHLWPVKPFFPHFFSRSALIFHLVPQRKFFTLWYPKGKKIAQGVEDRGNFFYFFGNFFQHVKKLLKFWNFLNIKVAKFKLNHLS